MTTRRTRPPRSRKNAAPASKPPPEAASGQNDDRSFRGGIEVRGAGDASAIDELASIDTGWDELLA